MLQKHDRSPHSLIHLLWPCGYSGSLHHMDWMHLYIELGFCSELFFIRLESHFTEIHTRSHCLADQIVRIVFSEYSSKDCQDQLSGEVRHETHAAILLWKPFSSPMGAAQSFRRRLFARSLVVSFLGKDVLFEA